MTHYHLIGSTSSNTPETQPREPAPHRCGRCNNGTGVYNPECPGRQRVDE